MITTKKLIDKTIKVLQMEYMNNKAVTVSMRLILEGKLMMSTKGEAQLNNKERIPMEQHQQIKGIEELKAQLE